MERLSRQLVAALRRQLSGSPARVPDAGALVWRWFADLCGTRTYGPTGPDPVSFAEIEAYARLHRWPLEPRHVELLRALDLAWLAFARTLQQGDAKRSPPPSYAAPLTAAAFDAVFA